MAVAKSQSQEGGPTPGAPRLHVAIVMDGNGRWAKRRGLPRTLGHPRGVEAIRRTVEAAPTLGVGWLTLYAFSTENWGRPPGEVSEVMRLLKAYVNSDLDNLVREGVRVRILGRREGLAPDIAEIVERAEARTAHNDGFHLQVAFNYGARADIVQAARQLMEAAREGRLDPEALDDKAFEARLSTGGLPPPDLVIRTSGEQRLSNFLLWESAYAEFVFQDVLWPDYGLEHLKAAIAEFTKRERRYGGTVADDVLAAG
ncbi:polyprenyl diphosphate synthase [Phenylobacterium sp.]|uniref:polyprenyl diphosphate synthase n=1 Tax=Phenylobacterium sp. TaxID=1871053 RepID=UPI0027358AB2|nr:polyprenyl diphosphate synthase [Phenylobacterium sp.]MDP3176024.1 polyprenyl diphosphate synthase [Phenylobacterium sp.]MDP3660591.1 polyprenyl diphosphate synthase [Phenylobacterium sp.]